MRVFGCSECSGCDSDASAYGVCEVVDGVGAIGDLVNSGDVSEAIGI